MAPKTRQFLQSPRVRVRVRVKSVVTRRFCTCASNETKLLKWTERERMNDWLGLVWEVGYLTRVRRKLGGNRFHSQITYPDRGKRFPKLEEGRGIQDGATLKICLQQ